MSVHDEAASDHAGTAALRARLCVLAGAVLWGTTGTTQALAPEAATSTQIGALRLVTGAVVLVVVALVTGGPRVLRAVLTTRAGATSARAVTLGAALAMLAYQLAFFGGVARTGVAVGTILTIGSAPVVAGVLGWAAQGHRPGARWVVATALAIAGVVLLVGSGGPTRIDAVGVGLALAAGVAYATYTVTAKVLLDAGHPPTAVLAVTFIGGGLVAAAIVAGGDLTWVATARGLAVVGWLALVTVGAAYLLYATGLRALPAATVATLTLAEPLTASALGLGVLGERPGTVGLVGAGLVAAGLVLLVARRRRAVLVS